MSDVAIRAEGLGKQYSPLAPRPGALITDRVTEVIGRVWGRRRAIGNDTRRGAFWALQDVGFEVRHGEAVGVIGRNGAGKSTLLRLLARITYPTTGRAELYGRVGALLEVGTGFHPELTGRENVFLNGAILGMRRGEIARKFDEIVSFAEVEAAIDTPVKYYSTGMRVRLGFAVAAHLETEILLMDEVLAVGDTPFQQKCLGKMGDAARAGRTVIFVSHDLTAVQVLCQRALRLSHGRVAGHGPVNDEIAAYLAETRREGGHASLDQAVELDARLRLDRLDLEPVPVVSGRPATLRIGLSAGAATRLDRLAVTIHDALHRRVGVIDVRDAGASRQVDPAQPLRLRVDLASLPLVEGEYQAGLILGSHDGRVERDGLMSFAVVAPADQQFVPEPSSTRGIVAFEYAVHAE